MVWNNLNGVTYDNLPPPSDLWRATQYDYAVELIQKGILYLTNAQVYREAEDVERGDPMETCGVFNRKGLRCSIDYANPIFLWCMTLDPDPSSLLTVWRDCDTVLHIRDPQMLAERILKSSKNFGVEYVSFHAGRLTYDKDRGRDERCRFADSIFQKPERHAHQREYRFALMGDGFMSECITLRLSLGPCSDLIEIIKRK